MESPVMFVLILATVTLAPVCSQSIYASENPLPVGSNVTLFSQTNVTLGVWMFNTDIIVMITPRDKIITDAWSNRVTFNSTTSSLTIRSVKGEDSGLYTLQALNSFNAQLRLSVQDPISNVTLRANATSLVEYNDTAVLVCSVSNGSSLTYVWLNDSSVVSEGVGVQLSDGGATLTLIGVTRYDEGPFRCNVSNGISHETSLPVHLNISFGPSNASVAIMPMKHTYSTGSDITLSCSAESSPPAMIQWMVNGVYLNEFTQQLKLEMVKENNSGNYKCLFHNTVTSRFTSASAVIRILKPIAAVVVNHTGGPAKLHYPFTLHCEVTGTVDYVQWLKNGQLISTDNTTTFSMDNKTLNLNPVQHSDNGDYQCQAFNYVSNMTSSPYTVEVNYGPMKPVIMGPSMALTGTQEILNCSSDSHPPSHISWYFNDTLLATTSQLAIGPLTLNMSGKYICVADNNVTGKNSSAYTMLTVLDPVTMASIKIVGAQPILNHTFTLTCETDGGVEVISWMYNWSSLYASDTRNLSMDNTTLTFDPVMFSDNGPYQCVASNPLSHVASNIFMLDVFYGPQMPMITGPKVAMTGDSVTLSCSASSNPLSIYKWFFNDFLVANTSEYVTPPLTMSMSGMYTCMAFNNITGKNSTAYTNLAVLDPIVDAQIVAPMIPAIEGQFYNLTCNVTGTAEHVYWMKNSEPLHEDNTTAFYMDNRTVTFNPLERNHTGNYECTAINAVWNMTSPPHKLFVNFGPLTPVINGPAFAETGRTADFSCSALSMPPSQFSWWFNGSEVANTSVFTTGPLSIDMSGEYTCMAYNNITGKNSTAYTNLAVLDPIVDAQIVAPMIPAIEGQFYNLTCNVTGAAEHVYWMKNGELLHEDNTTAFYMDNRTVTFSPLERNHTGSYECTAINTVWNMTSPPYLLFVNFGPLTPVINGPAFAETGRTADFSCSALSMPPSQFSWWFSGSEVANTSVFTTGPLSINMSGEYTCMAYNYLTGRNSTSSKMLTVIEAIESVMISNSTIPINDENLTLTCEITGPYEAMYWMKDNDMFYYAGNITLNFTPVTVDNDGTYQCFASNKAGVHPSPKYTLRVNYGPLSVKIDGSDSAEVGVVVWLTCSADSWPDCDFNWFHNNQSSPVMAGSVLTFPATKEKEGNYTCMARNPVTNITMYTTKAFALDHASALHIPSQAGLMLMGLFALSVTVLFN